MAMCGHRSIQDINNAVIAGHAEALRRLCGMTSYRRTLGDMVAIRGVPSERIPEALTILGLGGATGIITLLPDGRGWMQRVVHYAIDAQPVARSLGERDLLLILRCPPRRFAPYELAATA